MTLFPLWKIIVFPVLLVIFLEWNSTKISVSLLQNNFKKSSPRTNRISNRAPQSCCHLDDDEGLCPVAEVHRLLRRTPAPPPSNFKNSENGSASSSAIDREDLFQRIRDHCRFACLQFPFGGGDFNRIATLANAIFYANHATPFASGCGPELCAGGRTRRSSPRTGGAANHTVNLIPRSNNVILTLTTEWTDWSQKWFDLDEEGELQRSARNGVLHGSSWGNSGLSWGGTSSTGGTAALHLPCSHAFSADGMVFFYLFSAAHVSELSPKMQDYFARKRRDVMWGRQDRGVDSALEGIIPLPLPRRDIRENAALALWRHLQESLVLDREASSTAGPGFFLDRFGTKTPDYHYVLVTVHRRWLEGQCQHRWENWSLGDHQGKEQIINQCNYTAASVRADLERRHMISNDKRKNRSNSKDISSPQYHFTVILLTDGQMEELDRTFEGNAVGANGNVPPAPAARNAVGANGNVPPPWERTGTFRFVRDFSDFSTQSFMGVLADIHYGNCVSTVDEGVARWRRGLFGSSSSMWSSKQLDHVDEDARRFPSGPRNEEAVRPQNASDGASALSWFLRKRGDGRRAQSDWRNVRPIECFERFLG